LKVLQKLRRDKREGRVIMNDKDKKIAIVACSGASNTGQTTNEVARHLCDKSDEFTMICLAALTLNHKISLDKVADARKIVVIDGCPVKCASQILSKYTDKKPDIDIQVMEDYGIKKISKPEFDEDNVRKISDDILNKCLK